MIHKVSETGKISRRIRKRTIWITILSLFLVLAVIGGVKGYRILYKPQELFAVSTIDPSLLAPKTTPNGTAGINNPDATNQPAATADSADTNNDNKKILNILLIGIDRHEDGGKPRGADPHADVMMIVAINFEENKVDLISLPRDTFIHAPDIMNGVYKLNASFNVGGGFEATNGEGFLKVCDGAEYMLGGIPVDYYYAVDFAAVKNLVDSIGGIDYEVESSEYTNDGISGQRHMDGEDVLYYLRVRKHGPEQGDKNRVNRQKKMMIAIFSKMKDEMKLSMVPDLISAKKNGVFTNTTLEQTLALAKYATSIDSDTIGMYSMTGTLLNKASWGYCFTDQDARVDLIKQIYGLDVPPQIHCSSKYADWLVEYGFDGIKYQKTVKSLLEYSKTCSAYFTSEQQNSYDNLMKSYDATQAAYDIASVTLDIGDTRALLDDMRDMKNVATELANSLEYQNTLDWSYDRSYWNDPDINEVKVDFR